MRNYWLFIILMGCFQTGFAQNNVLWKGYFSYNEIKDVSAAPTKFFAASENALFSRNIATSSVKTVNTIDGLPSQTISSIYYSSTFNKTLVGYENGLMVVINENDGSILKVVDIINKQLPPNIKKINHFLESEGIVYISCDFGIVQYNLATLQFGDTYFIGSGIAEIVINQTAVYNGYIYASSPTEGIKRGNLTNPNLIDADQWEQVASGGWNGITAFANELYVVNSSNSNLNKFNGSSFNDYIPLNNQVMDLRSDSDYLVATTLTSVFVYNDQFNPVQINANQIPNITDTFTCATVVGNNIYIGTKEHGVITTSLQTPGTFQFISPDGPYRNAIFAINATTPTLWAVYGGYSQDYNPYGYNSGTPNAYPISKFAQEQWTDIPYSDLLGAKALVHITINPANENQLYISSFFSGLLKVENDEATVLYNETNSALESLIVPEDLNYKDIRVNGTAFDKSGNLWVTDSRIVKGLNVLKSSNQWQSFSMENILDVPEDNSFNRMVVDKNGTKWMSTFRDGVVGYNDVFKKIVSGTENGLLPIYDVRALAIDNRNQLWIGTTQGLRVLSSVDSFLGEQDMKVYPIIFVDEGGVAQELLNDQFITDIAVDGANTKWIATAEAGVFHVSANGQETLHRFTAANSPLPSDAVNDIDINPITGEVFFATTKGMVSFKGTSTNGSDDLNSVLVYPNPVRPEFSGTVKIANLIDKATIKITDIEGNLVYEVIAEGGTVEWDTTAFGKYRVASGVYMIFISSDDGLLTKVKKVMIIR
ncbi:MAG: T9SS type A sorting domain-containing protein [Flavobacterium sp.]|nr:T9SS type A sorting domain-containing protein [Flavobacterium sp.]